MGWRLETDDRPRAEARFVFLAFIAGLVCAILMQLALAPPVTTEPDPDPWIEPVSTGRVQQIEGSPSVPTQQSYSPGLNSSYPNGPFLPGEEEFVSSWLPVPVPKVGSSETREELLVPKVERTMRRGAILDPDAPFRRALNLWRGGEWCLAKSQSARVVMTFEIGSSGVVRKVEVSSDGLLDPRTKSCLVRHGRTVRFPPLQGAPSAKFTASFVAG